jgi:PAS domain S-box-containing protein
MVPDPIDPSPTDSEKRFQLLLETLPHIAFVIRPGGQAEYYNRNFIDYVGFCPGPDRADRTALNHPDDQAPLEIARAVGAAANTEYIVEARIRRHDGAYRWHRIHNKPLIRDGRAVGWIGTAVDIHEIRQANEALEQRVRQRTDELEAANRRLTAEIQQRQRTEDVLRESERRYRVLYNRTPMALHSVDAEARLIDVNDTWLVMFGYQREDVIGRSPGEFMTPESAEKYRREAWPGMLASRGMARTVDYQFLTRSGEIFDGRLAARGEFDAEGRFIRSWSAIADITSEKQANKELLQAQRMEAVGQLTAGIAHDFNNLLTGVLGNLELLSKLPDLATDRPARLLTSARNAAERGARLTTQLLAFSRQQLIAAEPTDVNCVIQEMLPLLQSTIGAAITVDTGLDIALGNALADATQLELALLNLVINARDAMPSGGAIRIATANAARGEPIRPEEPGAGDYISISVADTGSGMPPEIQERIFEPFFTTKPIGKGSGLGLPQVLGVVKQLGGGISVSSAPNQGTSITIFLPRDTQDGKREPSVSETTSTTDPSPHQTGRILLVDDDPDVRTVAVSMLESSGYEVIEAASGSAALDHLTHGDRPIDLMVADVAMPGMNGVELAKIVRHTLPALPVVFMTGYAEANLLPTSTTDEVLRKPFAPGELDAVVSRTMKRNTTAPGPMPPTASPLTGQPARRP